MSHCPEKTPFIVKGEPMKSLLNLALAIPLAAAMVLFAQQPDSQSSKSREAGQADIGSAKTYTGTIVDANCSKADSSSTTSGKHASKSEIMKHCAASSSTSSYALLTNDGSFLKLDDGGNGKLSSMSDSKKNMKVTVTGTAEGDTLKVQTLAKM
jgi:hypothetical protein